MVSSLPLLYFMPWRTSYGPPCRLELVHDVPEETVMSRRFCLPFARTPDVMSTAGVPSNMRRTALSATPFGYAL